MIRLLTLPFAILLLSCSDPEYVKFISTEDPSSFLITNVTIFDGRDSLLLENRNILIEGDRITAISKSDIPFDGEIIDGTGRFLMPGLIDAHVHLSGSGAVPWANRPANIPYNLEAYLYAGITTVYDLGGLSSDLEEISRNVEDGNLLGPNVFHTHIPITVRNSHPIPLTKEILNWPLNKLVDLISPIIDDPYDAQEIIEKYLKNGVDYVKIICDQIPPGSPEMPREHMAALVDAAHEHNKKVIAHIGSPQNAIDAIDAGVDVLAHGIWRGRLSEEQATKIAEAGIPIIYTAAAFHNVNAIQNGIFQPNRMDRVLVPQEILDPVTGKNGLDVKERPVMHQFFRQVALEQKNWKHNFDLLRSKGANILIGTDSNLPGTYAGSTYMQELMQLSNWGMSNYEVLRAATYLNAYAFLEDPNFGTVEVGKQADLLLLSGNPLENLDKIKSPYLIISRGRKMTRRQIKDPI